MTPCSDDVPSVRTVVWCGVVGIAIGGVVAFWNSLWPWVRGIVG